MKITECTCDIDMCEHHPGSAARDRVGTAIYLGVRSGVLLLEDCDDDESAELERVLGTVVAAAVPGMTSEVRHGLEAVVALAGLGFGKSLNPCVPAALAWIREVLQAVPGVDDEGACRYASGDVLRGRR